MLPGGWSSFFLIARHSSAVYVIDLISGPNLLEVRSPGMGTGLLPLWLSMHLKGTQVHGQGLCMQVYLQVWMRPGYMWGPGLHDVL